MDVVMEYVILGRTHSQSGQQTLSTVFKTSTSSGSVNSSLFWKLVLKGQFEYVCAYSKSIQFMALLELSGDEQSTLSAEACKQLPSCATQ